MANNEYTEKQLKIISGEIPIESVNGYVLRWLLTKALANNDEELAKKVQKQLDTLKAVTAEKNRRRACIRSSKIKRNEAIQWKQPKSKEYTEHQKQIVRGEIPYEDVHTNALINIHLKAQKNGDYELAERLYSLIAERHAEAAEKNKLYRRKGDKARRISAKFNSLTGIDRDLPLTHCDKAFLMGFEDFDECGEERLERILNAIKKTGDETLIPIVESLIFYKKDPSMFYVVKDHREAIDLIEALLDLPIRRPETWFCEEDKPKEDG